MIASGPNVVATAIVGVWKNALEHARMVDPVSMATRWLVGETDCREAIARTKKALTEGHM
ncbi:hypothetical protein FRC09_014376, partial [Ceratobasidium sp. 395]